MDSAIIDTILDRLAAGEPLNAICRTPGYPSPQLFRFHVVDDPILASRYTRARNVGLDHQAEQIVELADICREGVKVERKQVGWRCICGLGARWDGNRFVHYSDGSEACSKPEKIYEEKTITGDMVERARLQIDARKWLLSKMRPDKYGDRVITAGDASAPVEHRLTVVYEDKPAKMLHEGGEPDQQR